MFAYDGATRSSNKKILDVFWFKGKSLRIGYPLFQDERNKTELHKRVFIEYSEKASISVNHKPSINKIVFDHLMPETPNLKGMYEYYIPDMSYDAYFWENDFWNYQADIIIGNDKEKSRREYYLDEETGEEQYRIVPIDYVKPEGKDLTTETENGNSDPKALRKVQKTKKKKDQGDFNKMSREAKKDRRKYNRYMRKNKNRSSYQIVD
jgi:hypothetical protein